MRKELGFFTHYDTNNVNGVSHVTLKGMVIKGDATFKEHISQRNRNVHHRMSFLFRHPKCEMLSMKILRKK
jgi:hypothetical protein